MTVKADFAVIGAGVFGCWTALELANRGHSVVLADPHGAANARASSGGETRIIRMSYGEAEHYTAMASASLGKWNDLFSGNKEHFFQKTGALFTAAPDNPFFTGSLKNLRRHGIALENLAPAALAKRFPQMRFAPERRGIFEPGSGVLLARRAVQLVAETAVKRGVKFIREEIRPVNIGRHIQSPTVIYACGPWLPTLFPEQLGNRIWPTRQDVFFFGAGPQFTAPAMPAWVDFGASIYSVPDIENRGFKVAFDSHGPVFDPESGSRIVMPKSVAQIRKVVSETFPALINAPIVETRVCQYENTSNGDFLIDWLQPGVLIAGGGSGHGFKHGPAVGSLVADLAEGRLTATPPQFSLATKAARKARAIF